jgi:hypothetical protein
MTPSPLSPTSLASASCRLTRLQFAHGRDDLRYGNQQSKLQVARVTHEEGKMALPPPPACPQPQNFSVLTGFITPERGLAAGIAMAVVDPTENDEAVRVIETTSSFSVVVQWCICGPIVPELAGCWNVSVFIDDIDGVGSTHGQLGSTRATQVDSVPLTTVPTPESHQRCYTMRFDFPAATVQVGVYKLVAIITLRIGSCAAPGPLVGDTLGYAEIPALVFSQD